MPVTSRAAIIMGHGQPLILDTIKVDALFSIPPAELLFGKKLQGSSIGGERCRTGIPQLVDHLMDGEFDLDSLITARVPLDRISDGPDMLKRGEGIRTVVMY